MSASVQTQTTGETISPAELLSAFTTGSFRTGISALEQLEQVPNKTRFLQPILKFLSEEQDDGVRCWAASALAVIGGDRAFEALLISSTPPRRTRRSATTG